MNENRDTLKCDIRTPNGSSVITWAMCESSFETRMGYDNYFSQFFPDAIQIKTYDNFSSTRRFNCHGYAWIKEGGGADRWIGYDINEVGVYPDVFITDGSYTQVPSETYPGKVFWERPGDHTAVTTEQSGWFISKWNEWPLMKHKWDDSPFGTAFKYYIKTPTRQYPPHCDNCIQDGDEIGLDCGGSCPPCRDAPDNRIVDQDNLALENNALMDISTDGTLVLNSNDFPYSFIAGNEIALNSGFEIASNTLFSAKTTPKRNELTRNLRKVCIDIPNVFSPNGDGYNDFYGVHVAGVTFISIKIMNRRGNTLRDYATNVYEDGFIRLWDGGNQPLDTYYYEIIITTYEGENLKTVGYLTIL